MEISAFCLSLKIAPSLFTVLRMRHIHLNFSNVYVFSNETVLGYWVLQ